MVEYDLREPVAVITIDRPDRRNAIDDETAKALRTAWNRFDEDEAASIAILTGAEGDFSAGADLKELDLEDRPEGYLGFTRMEVTKPTIAAVEGHCISGGLEMAAWCDLRVAGAGATFGHFGRRFGVPLVDGLTQRLPRIVGLGRALELIHTGRALDADEAHAWGLVNRVVPDGEALPAALDMAETIASFPQTTVRADRRSVYEGLGSPLERGLTIEARHGRRALEVANAGADRFAAGAGRHGQGVPDW